MKRFSWLSVAILFILASLLLPSLFPGAAHADSMDSAKSNLQELTQAADSILVGTVTDRSSYWNDAHTQIYTSAVFSVEDKIKDGTVPGSVTITVPGGKVGDLGEWVSDAATFDQGEKAVVFVKKLKQAKSLPSQFPAQQFEVYQGFKGKFPIKGGKIDSLPVTEFKGRLNSILSGQTLPATELAVAPSVVTMPYSYLGYRWPASPALPLYYINENTPDCTGEGDAIRSAAATWSNNIANFSFSYAGPTTAAAAGYDGANEIMWVNLGNVGTIARTFIWYSGSTIVENDIEFNDYYNYSTSPVCPPGYYDVQTIALHEFGHWLALDDSYNSADSANVMYGYGYTGTTKRVLTSDDIAGIRSIYGLPGALAFVTSTLPDGAIGIAYSQTLLSIGGSGSYTWSITSGSLPAGLGLNSSTGLISGTPTAFGTASFTVQVNDGSTTVSKPLSISVVQKLTGSYTPDTGTFGINYIGLSKFTATATGTIKQIKVYGTAAGNVKVAIYSDNYGEPGTLLNANNSNNLVYPNRWTTISIADTFVFSGTTYWLGAIPDTASAVTKVVSPNPYRYKAQTYAGFSWPGSLTGLSTSDTVYLCIASFATGPTPLTITTTTLPDGERGVPYSQTLQAIGSSGTYTWSITVGSLPTGLSLTPSTGVIAGIPTTTGTTNFTAQVNDGSTTVTQPLSIYVSPPHQKLLGTDDAVAGGPAGASYLLMDRFAAVASGTVSQIRVKCTNAGSVKVALYNDISGSPGTLINANNTGVSVIAGWNNITIPSTPVISGTNYWIAYNSSPACVGYTASAGGAILFRALDYSTDFPASAGSGFTTASNYHSLVAGWGVVAPTPLTITTTSLSDGTVGVAYSQTLQATGGSGTYTWSITSGSLPAGLSPITSGGLISGTPTTTATYTFTAQVNDGSTTVSKLLSITVTVPLQKLLGTDDAVAEGPAGAGYLLMDRFAAVASGTVSQIRVKCTTAGSVKVALYNDISGSPGTLINANNTGAIVGAGWNNISLSTPVTAGTYYWIAYNSSPACVGYTASAGGAILFRAFDYSTDFPASAGSGFTTSSNYHSLVAGWGVVALTPLAITTTSLPDGTVGVPYSQTLQATGGSGSYTWSITSGSLPAGLSPITSVGLISGTPTTAATYTFTVQVNDGSTTVSKLLSITVTVPLQKLLGTDDAVAGGPAGAGYLLMDRFAAVSSGTVSQIRVKCTNAGSVKVALYNDISGSPGTLITANNTGAIVGAGWNNISLSTPVTAGTYYWIAYNSSPACVGYTASTGGAILFRALDYSTDFPASAGSGFTTASNYHSLVAGWGVAGPSPLTITTTSLPEGTVGVPYSQTLQATGGSGTYTWSITVGSLPAGLSPITSGGLISGTPTTAATYNFTAQVNDGSTTASQPLSINITVLLQKLLGTDDAVAGGPAGANYLLMDRFAAVSSGTVSQIRVKCTTGGSVKVALYTDNGGSPGTLITANNTGAIVGAGWNNISLSTPVTAGTYYWIAYNSSPACVGYTASAGGAILFRALDYSTDFPASAGSGFTTASNYHSLVAGWGVAGP